MKLIWNNKYIIHWCILIWKPKHIRCQFIDKYPLWVQFSSNPRKVASLRVYLPHSLWGEIEVLPPVESRLEPLDGSEELIKVVLFCGWRRIVYHECDVAGVSAIVRAQPDVISPHKTSLRCVCKMWKIIRFVDECVKSIWLQSPRSIVICCLFNIWLAKSVIDQLIIPF